MLWFLITLSFLIIFGVPLTIAALRKKSVRLTAIWSGIGLVTYVGLHISETVYPNVLWFREMGQESVYWIRFWPLLQWFCYGGIIAAIFLAVNILFTRTHLSIKIRNHSSTRITYWFASAIAFVAVLVFAGASTTFWDQYLSYSHQVPFPTVDPVFGNNVGFYIFTMPFISMLLNYGWVLLGLTIIGVAIIYGIQITIIDDYGWSLLRLESEGMRAAKRAVQNRLISHVSGLMVFVIVLLMFNIKYWQWQFLFENRASFSGAGYVDVTQRIGYYSFFYGVLAVSSVMFIISAFVRSWKLTVRFASVAAALSIAYLVVFLGILPWGNQHFNVSPNELSYETPYIERNITATRQAFGLDSVSVRPFSLSDNTLNATAVNDNRHTLDMVRLWDWTVLDANIQNNQSFRSYYHFPEPDVVRYRLDGQLVQVMASVRELDQAMIPASAQTWQNTKLVYTHGFGEVVVPVSGFDANGDPTFLLKDIPPVGSHQELEISEPRVYFGTLTDDLVFVKTAHHEFDHPVGDTNAVCTYDGTGGIELGSGLRSLILALRYEGIRQLTASELTPDSRILVNRKISERVKLIAPFLGFDSDPYTVIADGKMWFMLDGYTMSEHYPYSKSIGFDNGWTMNYIRNSVKVTIDAYNGTVKFYIFDEHDPIIQTYASIFPTLFNKASDMPTALRAHVRYPEDLFTVQSYLYAAYHMSNVGTFYNREDLWDIATEEYHVEGVRRMHPYFAAIRLPGETRDEYVLMLPFTPHTTDESRPKYNMVAWLAGRCDEPNYGKLLVYTFPKDRIVTGPMQIEARINQHDVASKDMTLWNQQGSRVIKGNLITVPLADSLILYVKPIFLQSANGRYPELKRVVVATNDKLAYAESFEAALRQLAVMSSYASGGDYVTTAAKYFDEYIKLVGQGKLTEAGQALEKLGVTLRDAEKNKTD